MRNVRVQLAYDGSRFFGWQRQEGFVSVQAAVEEALLALSGEAVTVHGSGRTDTGAHALRQVASFHMESRLDDDSLLRALNAHLPDGVAAGALESCPDDFHAQYDARGKRYGYLVSTARFRPPFAREYVHWIPQALDLDAMRAAARLLLGEHDFSSFANAGSPRRSNVRRLDALHIVARRRGFGLFVQGSGFLYNMVRTIAGTLFEVGRGKLASAALPELLAARDRRLGGPTAPAAGLYLLAVLYPEPCFIARRPRATLGGETP
jgi:tRNA pseudouridine38-40 synthase